MTHDAGLLHRTVAARAGQAPHPGLLLLHGRGADELDLIGLARELDPRFFVVSARAPLAWEIGYCWCDTEESSRREATFRSGLSLLRVLVEELAEAYPIDPKRLYLLGFSQGAYMANALTLTVPERVAGAVLLSGYQPPLPTLELAAAGVRGKPFFVGHGTLDPLLTIERGREVRDTLAGLGADLTYVEHAMGHQIILPELEEIQAWLSEQLDRTDPAGDER